MLLAHVPAAISTLAEPRLDLDGAKAVANVVRHNDVAVRDARRRERSDHAPSQQLAHHEVLTRRTC
jgi:hypothetical protein